jgi:hypothetical protein
MMPIVYGAIALLFAAAAIGSLAGAIGFAGIRLWAGAVFLTLLALPLGGAAFAFAMRALE